MATRTDDAPTFAPRFPTLLALGLLTAWILILFLPMFPGHFLGGDFSDQTWAGIPFRRFWADEFRRTGGVPLWNPYMFGGLPFVGAMHGDMFYPTSFLRAFLEADTTLTLVFFVHLVLAGWFTYAFLRSLSVSWTGSLTGGLAYQLSGIVASLVQPGHDGKLIVSALLPLLLTGLVLGIRRRRLEGYGIVALTVGLDILSPQIQMAQYSLIAAGLFTLWLCFLDDQRPETPRGRVTALGLAAAAVVLGVGMSMIQMMPFLANNPYAARTAGNQGWDYATRYAMPPENIVDWVVPEFTGILRNYWGSNFFKLHSEYVGAATLALAVVGVASPRRRKLVWILGGLCLLFVLVSLGGHTPFYRLWYALVPGVKVTRAPGMAFFIPTFVFAALAGFGVERLEHGEGRKLLFGALAGAGVLLLLGASGALAGLATSLAQPLGTDAAALQNQTAITFGAVRSALVVALAAGLGLAVIAGRVRGIATALLLVVLVGGDLFYNARRFFTWSPRASELYADDDITRRLAGAPKPYRLLDLPQGEQCCQVYPTAFLMGMRIPAVIGHHGNELHRYDELLGGKNVWRNLGHVHLWDLLAVRYLVLARPLQVPGYHIVDSTAASAPFRRAPALLYEADTLPEYARVVAAAAKVQDDRIVPTLLDPRLDYDRLLLLPEDAPVQLPRLEAMPPRSASRATVTAWEPGAMTVHLDPAPDNDAWLLVSENWYPDWRATVDGRAAPVYRGDYTLISVPVPRGSREVRLSMVSASYRKGRGITMAAFGGIVLLLGVPLALRRRRG
jgi:hypothetical protein